MAFTSTITRKENAGSEKKNHGTYTSADASTGGDINTGLKVCDSILLQPKGSSVGNAPMVDETLPVAGGAVTIKTDSNEVGYWSATGW